MGTFKIDEKYRQLREAHVRDAQSYILEHHLLLMQPIQSKCSLASLASR